MSIENIINEAWEKRDQITPGSDENLKNTVNEISLETIEKELKIIAEYDDELEMLKKYF